MAEQEITEGQLIETYRGYAITAAPVFQREYRFNFCHPDYDGPEDKRCGFATTVQGCRDQIDELEPEPQSRYTEAKLNELLAAAMPLMDWLKANHHPHVTAIVDSHKVEVVEGLACAIRKENS